MCRGVSPVVGVVLLVAVTIILSATLVAGVPGEPADPPPRASLALSADASTDTVELVHEGGDPVDVTALEVTVTVDGEELRHQPPVPFFAAFGFESGPTGPFNLASDGTFRAGETASFTVASTNDPPLDAGSSVTVRLTTRESVVFEGTATA